MLREECCQGRAEVDGSQIASGQGASIAEGRQWTQSAVSWEESRDSKASKNQRLILVSFFYYVYRDGVLFEIESCGFLSDIKSIPSILSLLKSLLGCVICFA